MTTVDERKKWDIYLRTTKTYGTFENRVPEYQIAMDKLLMLGLHHDDLVVDVGAGSCDMDHYMRTVVGWRGKYLPIDGATYGIDFNKRLPYTYLPNSKADFYISLETLEHVYDPERIVRAMQQRAAKGIVVTTPNPEVVDVLAVDPTHVISIWPRDLEEWGFIVTKVTLNDRGEGDTLVGFWTPDMVRHDEDFPVG